MNDNVVVPDKNKDTYTYDEAVEMSGHGRYSYLMLITCCVIINACALDMFGFATVVAAARCDLNMDLKQLGILASAPFAGVIFAFPWGYYADTQGRKRALILSTSVGFVFSVVSSFSTHWVFMLVVKTIGCSFSSTSFSLTVTILGESIQYKHRSRYVFITHSFNLASEFVSFSLAWLILPLNFKVHVPWLDMTIRPWRLYNIVQALPLGVGAMLMLYLYESPKFLASRGQYAKALEVLRSIYERNGGKREEYPVKRLTQQPSDTENLAGQSFWQTLVLQTWPIFKIPLLWRTIQLFFLMIICCTASNVFVMWYPTIVNLFFQSFNVPIRTDQTFCERAFGETNIFPELETQHKCIDEISTNTIYAGMLYGLFYCLVSGIVSKISSKPRLVLIACLLVSGSSMILVNLKNPVSNMIFFTLLPATSVGVGCIFPYFVDLYPTRYRGMATSLGMMAGRLSSLVIVSVMGTIITQYCHIIFYAWSAVILSSVVVCLFLPADRKSPK